MTGRLHFESFRKGSTCEIELTGPADPQTGIQFIRTIRLDADSPRIGFHASMKNITGHTLEWSMQSVSQYDTSTPPRTIRGTELANESRFLDLHSCESIQQLISTAITFASVRQRILRFR